MSGRPACGTRAIGHKGQHRLADSLRATSCGIPLCFGKQTSDELHRGVAPGEEALHRETRREFRRPIARVRDPTVEAEPGFYQPGRRHRPAPLRVRPELPASPASAAELRATRGEQVAVRHALSASSELKRESWRERVIEVRTYLCLLDTAQKFRVREIRKREARPVTAVVRAQIQRAAPRTWPGPAHAHEVVPPVPVDSEREVLRVEAGQVEYVLARVRGDQEAITGTALALHDRLEVRQVVGELERGLEQHVEIGAARRHPVADARPSERVRHGHGEATTHGEARREQRDPGGHVQGPLPGIGFDIQYRRDASAVLRGKASRLELDAVDHVGVEDGEQAAEMERAEHGHAVEKDEVLVL